MPFATSTMPVEQLADFPKAQTVPVVFHAISGTAMVNRMYSKYGSFFLGKLSAMVPCLLIYIVKAAITAVIARNVIRPMKYALSKSPCSHAGSRRSDP